MKELFRNIKSYLKAVFGPKVQFVEYIDRLNQCSTCPWRVEKSNRNYCKECGCPKSRFWPHAELKTKCSFKHSTCPRKRWDKLDYLFTD